MQQTAPHHAKVPHATPEVLERYRRAQRTQILIAAVVFLPALALAGAVLYLFFPVSLLISPLIMIGPIVLQWKAGTAVSHARKVCIDRGICARCGVGGALRFDKHRWFECGSCGSRFTSGGGVAAK